MLALSWFAAAIGILVRSPEAAQGITFLVSFLPYPSSAFVPIHTMPSWLQGFASNQPVTAVADATRALLNGTPVGADAWHAIAWSIAIVVGSIAACRGPVSPARELALAAGAICVIVSLCRWMLVRDDGAHEQEQ